MNEPEGVVTVDDPLLEERLWMGTYKLDDEERAESEEWERDEDDIRKSSARRLAVVKC